MSGVARKAAVSLHIVSYLLSGLCRSEGFSTCDESRKTTLAGIRGGPMLGSVPVHSGSSSEGAVVVGGECI